MACVGVRLTAQLGRADLHGELLLAKLLYGTGMRLNEGLRLRVKDVDFDRLVLVVRDGKGGKDRVVMLPQSLDVALRAQLAQVGTDIRTVQELLGHSDVSTTMIYTHVRQVARQARWTHCWHPGKASCCEISS